jgi:hypothetical protein
LAKNPDHAQNPRAPANKRRKLVTSPVSDTWSNQAGRKPSFYSELLDEACVSGFSLNRFVRYDQLPENAGGFSCAGDSLRRSANEIAL